MNQKWCYDKNNDIATANCCCCHQITMMLCSLSLNLYQLSSESQWHHAVCVSTRTCRHQNHNESQWHHAVSVSTRTCHQITMMLGHLCLNSYLWWSPNHNDRMQSLSQLVPVVIRITMTLRSLCLNSYLSSSQSQWRHTVSVSTRTCRHHNHNDAIQSLFQLVPVVIKSQWHDAVSVSTRTVIKSQWRYAVSVPVVIRITMNYTMTKCSLCLNTYLPSCFFTSLLLFLNQFLFLLGQVLANVTTCDQIIVDLHDETLCNDTQLSLHTALYDGHFLQNCLSGIHEAPCNSWHLPPAKMQCRVMVALQWDYPELNKLHISVRNYASNTIIHFLLNQTALEAGISYRIYIYIFSIIYIWHSVSLEFLHTKPLLHLNNISFCWMWAPAFITKYFLFVCLGCTLGPLYGQSSCTYSK